MFPYLTSGPTSWLLVALTVLCAVTVIVIVWLIFR